MGYDRGDSFSLDFEPNGFPFGSKSKGKLSPRSYPIQFERKGNTSFLSVRISFAEANLIAANCDIANFGHRGSYCADYSSSVHQELFVARDDPFKLVIAIDSVILTRIARYLLKCLNLLGLKE